MKKIIIIMLIFAVGNITTVYSQSWGRTLGRLAENAAKRAVERNVEKATEKAIDRSVQKAEEATERAIDQAIEKKRQEKGRAQKSRESPETTQINEKKISPDVNSEKSKEVQVASTANEPLANNLEIAYAKSDFVAGDEIMFDDDVTREQIGEFPSQWDLIKGTTEVAQINGNKVILCVSQDDAVIVPLFDKAKSYLPEKFTLEFDFWVGGYEKKSENNPANEYHIRFYKPNSNTLIQQFLLHNWYYSPEDYRTRLNWDFLSLSEEMRSGQDESFRTIPNSWNHFALSFNKRAMKVYINGIRYANIPNTIAPGYFDIEFYRTGGYFTNNTAIRNIRIAKGAVPLYERLMSAGKFITYGITFDVGKSAIKPESMGEIRRIVQLMNENPDLKFSVEGHTDSTGNAQSNQALSEARSQTIVNKLIEMGIAKERLVAVGKGQGSPIADNSTNEGRAKNRRVEFVKM